MSVRMWPSLPKDFTDNGLGSIEKLMVDDPDARFYVVAEVNRRRATIDDDAGETVPTMRVLRIEPLTGDMEDTARQMLDAATMKRTSAGTLFDNSEGESEHRPASHLASVPFSGKPKGRGHQGDDDD